MNERKSFLLYLDYEEHLLLLDDSQRGRLFSALFVYARTGEKPKLTGAEGMAFSFISSQMDRDNEKWQAIRDKKVQNGKRGGRPKANGFNEEAKKANGFSEKQSKAKKANGFSEKQNEAKKAVNVNVNANVNVNDNVTGTVTEYIPPKPPTGEAFEKFWESYPRKTAKQAARKAFDKLHVDEVLLNAMLDALDWQKQTPNWKKDNGQFVPYPSTWLNNHRWEDEKPDVMPGETGSFADVFGDW